MLDPTKERHASRQGHAKIQTKAGNTSYSFCSNTLRTRRRAPAGPASPGRGGRDEGRRLARARRRAACGSARRRGRLRSRRPVLLPQDQDREALDVVQVVRAQRRAVEAPAQVRVPVLAELDRTEARAPGPLRSCRLLAIVMALGRLTQRLPVICTMTEGLRHPDPKGCSAVFTCGIPSFRDARPARRAPASHSS